MTHRPTKLDTRSNREAGCLSIEPNLKMNCMEWPGMLCGSIDSLRQREAFCDTEVVGSDGHKQLAHSCVLASSSPILSKQLLSNTPPYSIYVKGISGHTWSYLLRFMYTGETQPANMLQAEMILEAGKQLDIEPLVTLDHEWRADHDTNRGGNNANPRLLAVSFVRTTQPARRNRMLHTNATSGYTETVVESDSSKYQTDGNERKRKVVKIDDRMQSGKRTLHTDIAGPSGMSEHRDRKTKRKFTSKHKESQRDLSGIRKHRGVANQNEIISHRIRSHRVVMSDPLSAYTRSSTSCHNFLSSAEELSDRNSAPEKHVDTNPSSIDSRIHNRRRREDEKMQRSYCSAPKNVPVAKHCRQEATSLSHDPCNTSQLQEQLIPGIDSSSHLPSDLHRSTSLNVVRENSNVSSCAATDHSSSVQLGDRLMASFQQFLTQQLNNRKRARKDSP